MSRPRQKDTSNTIIESELNSHLSDLEDVLNGDIIVFQGPLTIRIDDIIRNGIEQLRQNKRGKGNKLFVILGTNGGYIEVVERIVHTLRKHYRRVEFIIPDSAMSAGTVLVLSGDAIYMDYYSVLGPIDPQVENIEGRMVPALGYLEEYNVLIEKAKAGGLTTEETTYLVKRFDPAELYSYKQARNLSVKLLEEWLAKYKFRNWKKTETRGIKVTTALRKERAAEIAKQLNDTNDWCSHGRGISMDVLRRKLKLQIEDFEQNEELNQKIRSYYGLLEDYMGRLRKRVVLHFIGHFNPIC